MEKLSRVKKYEDLRKNIETGIDESQNDRSSNPYATNLSDVSPAIFKRMEITEDDTYVPEREKVTPFNPVELDSSTSDFQNEYLDDFINEVREYNIKKGTRECENTQIDILSQLNSTNRMRRSQYIEDIKEEKKPDIEDTINTMSNDEIAKEVKSLLDQTISPMGIVREKEPAPLPPIKERVEGPVEQTFQEHTPKPLYESRFEQKEEPARTDSAFRQSEEAYNPEPMIQKEPIRVQEPAPVKEVKKESIIANETVKPRQTKDDSSEVLHRKLVEETQQLRMQMDEYEEELTDLSDGVEKTNKMLNFILCILILALLVIIGVVVYWLIQAGGSI